MGVETFVERPEFFFEKEFLTRLRNFLNPQTYISDGRWCIRPGKLKNVAENLTSYGINLAEIKTLDMGSGYGFVVSAFALHNLPVYGIEQNRTLIEICNRKFNKMDMDARPEIMKGNYYSDCAYDLEFKDGTTLKDIDFFFCYSYSPEHAEKVLVDSLSGPDRAKKGAIAYLDNLKMDDSELLKWGFEALNIQMPGMELKRANEPARSPWVRKISYYVL
ncbi:MAG TPA: hypothetical protein ENN30_02150 [Candidatus Woesearchaeota archaeon]|nr:hypothetical protein [Candidatus Woesearchaeota archaeon]